MIRTYVDHINPLFAVTLTSHALAIKLLPRKVWCDQWSFPDPEPDIVEAWRTWVWEIPDA